MVAYERDALARQKMTSDFQIVLAGVFTSTLCLLVACSCDEKLMNRSGQLAHLLPSRTSNALSMSNVTQMCNSGEDKVFSIVY